ncbi:MAG: transglutaminase-like domain-containing protein [Balneolaceae bacterium]
MTTTRTEIKSLISLLEDPDPEVQSSVQNRFRELGENAVPLLDQYRTQTSDHNEKTVIRDIIHNITFGSLYEDFSELLDEGMDNRKQLEKSAFLLARFGNPTLRIEEYQRKLDRFATEIRSDITYHPSDNRQMHILLNYVFSDLQFRGDERRYHDPENAFIDRVLDRRRGLPVMLSLIVIFIARRLDLPFHGVNMPIHFMLVFEGQSEEILIDPLDGGAIVTYDQCYYFLKKNGIKPRPEHLKKADEREIVSRTVRNLMHSYSKKKREDKVRDLQSLLQLIELKG